MFWKFLFENVKINMEIDVFFRFGTNRSKSITNNICLLMNSNNGKCTLVYEFFNINLLTSKG